MTTTARLGVILESDGAKYAMPLGGITAIIAIVGFIFPQAMTLALAIIGIVAGLMASLTWLHLQVVGIVVIAKIVTDCFYYVSFGDYDDQYND